MTRRHFLLGLVALVLGGVGLWRWGPRYWHVGVAEWEIEYDRGVAVRCWLNGQRISRMWLPRRHRRIQPILSCDREFVMRYYRDGVETPLVWWSGRRIGGG